MNDLVSHQRSSPVIIGKTKLIALNKRPKQTVDLLGNNSLNTNVNADGSILDTKGLFRKTNRDLPGGTPHYHSLKILDRKTIGLKSEGSENNFLNKLMTRNYEKSLKPNLPDNSQSGSIDFKKIQTTDQNFSDNLAKGINLGKKRSGGGDLTGRGLLETSNQPRLKDLKVSICERWKPKRRDGGHKFPHKKENSGNMSKISEVQHKAQNYEKFSGGKKKIGLRDLGSTNVSQKPLVGTQEQNVHFDVKSIKVSKEV